MTRGCPTIVDIVLRGPDRKIRGDSVYLKIDPEEPSSSHRNPEPCVKISEGEVRTQVVRDAIAIDLSHGVHVLEEEEDTLLSCYADEPLDELSKHKEHGGLCSLETGLEVRIMGSHQ